MVRPPLPTNQAAPTCAVVLFKCNRDVSALMLWAAVCDVLVLCCAAFFVAAACCAVVFVCCAACQQQGLRRVCGCACEALEDAAVCERVQDPLPPRSCMMHGARMHAQRRTPPRDAMPDA